MSSADVRIGYDLKRLRVSGSSYTAIADLANRLEDLLQLVRAHQAASGTGPGKRVGIDAVNRAALVMLTGHFQGFVTDLFAEAWTARFPGSDAQPVLARFRLNNPWPSDIDALFALLGQPKITERAERRPTGSKSGPGKTLVMPIFARARSAPPSSSGRCRVDSYQKPLGARREGRFGADVGRYEPPKRLRDPLSRDVETRVR